MDFAIIFEEMGGINEFADYDFRMKNSTLVNHPSNLIQASAVQALVHRKLGLPNLESTSAQLEVPEVPVTNESVPDIPVQVRAEETQATKVEGTSAGQVPTDEAEEDRAFVLRTYISQE